MPEMIEVNSSAFVGDALKRAESRGVIECYEPATRKTLGTVPVTPPESLPGLVERARKAQGLWAKTSFDERRQGDRAPAGPRVGACRRALWIVLRDSGKTRHNAMLGEVWPVVEKARWTIANGEKFLQSETLPSGVFVHKRARVEYAPLGVIGIIAPWNYPLQNTSAPPSRP